LSSSTVLSISPPFKHNVVNNNDYATKVVAKVMGSNLPRGPFLSTRKLRENYGIKLSSFLVIVGQLAFSDNNAEVISFRVFSLTLSLKNSCYIVVMCRRRNGTDAYACLASYFYHNFQTDIPIYYFKAATQLSDVINSMPILSSSCKPRS
jgi:hypothetical protein